MNYYWERVLRPCGLKPITDFEYFYGDGGSDKINEIIELFDTGISEVKLLELIEEKK